MKNNSLAIVLSRQREWGVEAFPPSFTPKFEIKVAKDAPLPPSYKEKILETPKFWSGMDISWTPTLFHGLIRPVDRLLNSVFIYDKTVNAGMAELADAADLNPIRAFFLFPATATVRAVTAGNTVADSHRAIKPAPTIAKQKQPSPSHKMAVNVAVDSGKDFGDFKIILAEKAGEIPG